MILLCTDVEQGIVLLGFCWEGGGGEIQLNELKLHIHTYVHSYVSINLKNMTKITLERLLINRKINEFYTKFKFLLKLNIHVVSSIYY